MLLLKVKGVTGVPFNVITRPDMGHLMVIFFDARYKKGFSKYGQQCATYYASTLIESFMKNGPHGITLYGGVPDWSVPQKEMKKVISKLLKAV